MKKIRREFNFAKVFLATAIMALAFQIPEAGAATIVMNASDAFATSSFNSGLNWTGGAAPAPGNSYQTAAFMLRTPQNTTSLAFLGDSLEVQPGGSLRDKTAATITITNLILDNTATLELTQPNNVNSASDMGVLAGAITLNAGTATFHAGINGDTAGETFIINAAINGTGGITTAGSSGNIILTGSNTYAGLTTVSAGTLGGSGTILGPVTVTGNGTLAPGGTTNTTLTISNTLTLAGIVSMKINKTGTTLTSDLIKGISTVNYGGTLIVTATGNSLTNGDSFTLFNAVSYTNSFSAYNLPSLASGLTWDVSQLTNGRVAVATVAITNVPVIVMNASDAKTTSSFNSGLNWTGGAAPAAGNSYQTAAFMLRTPQNTTSLAFLGDSLEVQPGGSLRDKTAATITITNLILDDTATLELTQPNGIDSAADVGVLAGGITLNGTAAFHAGISPDTAGETFIISATIGGTGGFTTSGSLGNILLTGNNTYTGLTSVSAGSLGGTGTIRGPVTVTSGGTLSPGGTTNSTLTISNTLTLGYIVSMKINKTGTNLTSDLIRGMAVVSYGGTLTVTATGDSLALGDTFTLFNAASYTNSFSTYNLPFLASGLTWDTSQLTNGRLTVIVGTTAPAFPYLDPSLTPEARAADLISRMTLAEKAAQLYYLGTVNTRLGIPNYGGWNQCLHGVWMTQPSTLFPISIAAAATWDTNLVYMETSAISDEARAFNKMGTPGPNGGTAGLIYRAPVINISRNPFWGRIQECFGEDPWLDARITVSYLHGLQGNDPKYLKLAGTLKHFAVYNVEDGRTTNNAVTPERWLYEYFLPHFKAGVTEGNAQSLMASYNLINGIHSAVNTNLLTDILRTKWGFKGFVVSDSGGIGNMINIDHIFPDAPHADAASLPAGCDYDDTEYRDSIVPAVTNGLLSEDVVNQALMRLLKVAFRLGVFDPPAMVPYSQISSNVIRSTNNIALSLKVAQSSIVLLKNQNGFLPLNTNQISKIALIGPLAATFRAGNYYGGYTGAVTPQQGFINRVAPGTQVLYAQGCSNLTTFATTNQINAAIQAATNAQVVIMCLGTDPSIEAEGLDRTALELTAAQENLLETIYPANTNLVLVLLNAGPLAIPWAKTNAPAILEAWYAGEQGGNAIADVVFGNVNPSGKLPYTVYPSSTVPGLPPQSQYDVSQGFTYMFFTNQALFPFGHGLSYTTFGYSNLVFSVQTNTPDSILNLSLDVWNTGTVAGAEVAQVYVHNAASSIVQAIKKLVGFQKVYLTPGQKQTLNFTVSVDQLSYYDATNAHDFVVDSGNYNLMVGSSSADIRLTNTFSLSLPPVILPGAPGELSAALYGTSSVLDWNFASRAASYTVKRAVNYGGPFTVIASGLTNNTFTDAAIILNATNYYVVTAFNSAGESLPSAEVNVIAPNRPVIQSVGISASGLIFTGTGDTNATYYLLGTTNLAAPLNNWTRLLTNQFDGNGHFNFTNPFAAGTPQQFYILQLP